MGQPLATVQEATDTAAALTAIHAHRFIKAKAVLDEALHVMDDVVAAARADGVDIDAVRGALRLLRAIEAQDPGDDAVSVLEAMRAGVGLEAVHVVQRVIDETPERVRQERYDEGYFAAVMGRKVDSDPDRLRGFTDFQAALRGWQRSSRGKHGKPGPGG